MAESCCSASEAFSRALSFSLVQLGLPNVVLKEEQRCAVKAIYEGRDVFVCLPTGYGKSLCYQTLPFVMNYKRSQTVQEARERDSAIIVVSPLVALMEDQVSGLRKHGVKASIITSSASVTREHISTGSLATDNVFFCAPEVLVASKWRDAFERPEFSGRIVAVVVDEAHCVSKW